LSTSRSKPLAAEAKKRGNTAFAEKKFEDAIQEYTAAILLSPEEDKEDRAVFHANRAACYLRMEQWAEVVADCTVAIELNPRYINAIQRRASAYEEQDKLAEALDDWKAVIELEPTNSKAKSSAARLGPVVHERQEQQKAEMLGKLKDLGNGLLGKFGLSLDSFQAQKDPTTGSYNISFKK